ncbi:type II secretion system F family protein [bacterium]|nr:type II secretion system F family protein [bacterium]
MTPESKMGASFRTLAFMLGKEIPLHRALEQSSEICGSSSLKKAWKQMGKKVKMGISFEEAIEKETSIPTMYRELLIQSVRSGKITETLVSLASHQDMRMMMQSSFIDQIIPLMSLLITTVAFGFVWTFHIVPLFSKSYFLMGAQIPFYLHPLFSAFWAIPAILVALAIYRYFFGRGLLRARSVHQYMEISIALRGLSIFVASGLPLHKALRAVSLGGFQNAVNPVEHGETLGNSLRDELVPVSLSMILNDANKKGDMDSVCEQLSVFYRRMAFARLRWLACKLFPVLLALCGFIAAVAIFSGYLTYFGTIDSAIGALSI